MVSIAGYDDDIEFARTGQLTRDLLQETVGIDATDVVLEIGAGIGRVGEHIAPLCQEWIGADVSPAMLGHLRRRLARFANVRTHLLTGVDLSGVPDATIDLVYATVVFMHLAEWDRWAYIREGFRVLKPGGRMLVDNFDLTSDEGWAFFQKTAEEYPAKLRPPQISRSSTPDELATYFRRAGFSHIEQQRRGLWLVTHGRKSTKD